MSRDDLVTKQPSVEVGEIHLRSSFLFGNCCCCRTRGMNKECSGGVCVSMFEKCEIIGRRGAAPGGCTRCQGGLMIVLRHATCLNKDECVFDSVLLFVGHDLDFPTVWSHYRGMTAINKLLDCSWHCVYRESRVLKYRRPFGTTVTKFHWVHSERDVWDSLLRTQGSEDEVVGRVARQDGT